MDRQGEGIMKILKYLFGWIKGTDAVVCAGVLASFLWFVIDWCLCTTFRPMSIPLLYLVNITATLVVLLPWMLSGKRWMAITAIFVLDILFESNLLYCRTYMTAIPPESYLIAGNMKDFMESAVANMRTSDIGFIVILVTTGVLSLKTRRIQQNNLLLRYVSLTFTFAGFSAIYMACLGGFYKAYDDLTQDWMTYASGVPTYTIAGHIAFKLMENARFKNPNEHELAEVDFWLKKHKEAYQPNKVAEPRKNLVLVICESLESWPIGLMIDGKEVTPYLNSLVNDSSSFFAPNVLTQVCAGHSIDGQLLYTTGLLPTSNTVYSMKYSDRNFPSLNKLLRHDRNTRSILMTTDKPITWNSGEVTRHFGYDTVISRSAWREDEKIYRTISDGSLFRQTVEMLKKGKIWKEGEPTMLTLITFSGHHPYVLPAKLKDTSFDISGKGYPKELADYITMTHYVDSQLPILIDYLKGRDDRDDNLIVIVGDHEALGTKRKDMRASSPEAARMVSPHRFTPFIVLNSPIGGKYNEIMGQVDVFPTVLDMLGVTADTWRGMGVSVLDRSKPGIAFSASPPEVTGNKDSISADVLNHIGKAQKVSEFIIIHDLLKGKI